jgi:hypothetical protein
MMKNMKKKNDEKSEEKDLSSSKNKYDENK